MMVPKIDRAKPTSNNGAWFRFKTNFSITKVNRGAKVPRKVALAMVVSFMALKKRAK